MVEAKYIGTLKDGNKVYQVVAPLDKQIEAFIDTGIGYPYLVSPNDVALIRLEGISNDFSRTCMAPVRVKGKPTILTRVSPFTSSPEIARLAEEYHRNRKYPSLPSSFYDFLEATAKEQSSLEPEDRDVHILEGRADSDGKLILTPEMPDIRFILRKDTARYFKQFKHSQIPFYNLPDNAPKDRTDVNYLWFDRPGSGSYLGCWDWDLDDDSRAFGVLRKSAKGTSKKKLYSLTNVRKAMITATQETLEQLGLTGIKDKLPKKLEDKVLEVLRKQ